ncbi:MAG: multidrug efflux SMR transporter [Thermoplasmata archaeon]|nr:multidrug efflux SMR transporter [Thermoplasmata archaeon]MDO5861264.1 multidrug efflux SMR transporter [Thermoplasmata archaeon]
MDAAILWVVAGGLLEPVWVVALKRFDERRTLAWGLAAVFFAVLSPCLMGMGMKTMSVGVAYAVWTGIGAVCTMIAGYLLYGERVGALKMVFVGMILAGVVGLELFAGASQ